MNSIAVNIKNLTKNFGTGNSEVRVLRGINITIMQGEFIIIFGPSGSGKSTLLNIINGLETPTSGEIIIDGENISQLSDQQRACFHRDKIGMVFQAYNLIPSLTVSQNITLPLVFAKRNVTEREQRVKELLIEFELESLSKRLPSEISGGQQQRISIMRALVNRPPIIVADEPTGNLDSVSSANVMKLFSHLNIEYKNTLIIVTHDQSLFKYADRIIHILDGQIIKENTRQKVKLLQHKNSAFDNAISITKNKQMRLFLQLLHVLLSRHQLESMDKTELDRTIGFMKEFQNGNLTSHELYVALDKPVNKDGAGLYRPTAHHIAESMENMKELLR